MELTEDFEFSESALEELRKGGGEYYVYCFIDPENSDGKRVPFYVGKGKENRITHDTKRIKEIEEKGNHPERWMIHYGLTESEAFAAEEALINFSQGILGFELDNKISGKNHTEPMLFENVDKFLDYEAINNSDIKTDELILVVHISSGDLTEDQLRTRTLESWKISPAKRNKIKYVVGIKIGSGKSVVSAYEVDDYKILGERTAFMSKSISAEIIEKLGLNKKKLESNSQNFWYING